MKAIGVLLHECSAEEIKKLPQGFPVLEYDGLYESLRIVRAREERIKQEKRYVYLLYKLPPAGIEGEKRYE